MRLFAVSAAALLTWSCGPAAHASSLFEGDKEGWKLSNNGDGTEPTLAREGGNSGGNLCGKDQGEGDIWYFVAPRKYLGNVLDVLGKRLTFDLKQSNSFNQIRGRDVVLNGAGLAISWNLRAAPGRDWTPNRVTFDDSSGWVIDEANGTPATLDDLRTVLGDLTSLRIRGEFYDGPGDETCLDNVYFGRD